MTPDEEPSIDSAREVRRELVEWVDSRVGELRRRQRRLRWVVGATVLVALLAVGAVLHLARSERGAADVVEARRITLVDEDGRTRGSWKIRDDGGSVLVMRDREGEPRLRLTLMGDGAPGLAMLDGRGQSRLAAGVLPEGMGTLVLADESGATRGIFGTSPDGSASLVFPGPEGRARAGIGVADDGSWILPRTPAAEPPEAPADSVAGGGQE